MNIFVLPCHSCLIWQLRPYKAIWDADALWGAPVPYHMNSCRAIAFISHLLHYDLIRGYNPLWGNFPFSNMGTARWSRGSLKVDMVGWLCHWVWVPIGMDQGNSRKSQLDSSTGLCEILWVISDWLLINYSPFKGYQAASDGKFAMAKKLVPECFDICNTMMIQWFFCKTWRYVDTYWYIPYLIHWHCWWTPCDSKGLNLQQIAFAIKCYK